MLSTGPSLILITAGTKWRSILYSTPVALVDTQRSILSLTPFVNCARLTRTTVVPLLKRTVRLCPLATPRESTSALELTRAARFGSTVSWKA